MAWCDGGAGRVAYKVAPMLQKNTAPITPKTLMKPNQQATPWLAFAFAHCRRMTTTSPTQYVDRPDSFGRSLLCPGETLPAKTTQF